MELSEKFETELSNLKQAVSTYNKAINLPDQYLFDEVTKDLIKNGKIQKFEYCSELAWKVSKMYLELKTGEIAISPKQVYKTMFLAELINEDLYKGVFQTIEDRNKLSHIYKEEMYDLVYYNLSAHLNAFERLLEILNDKQT
jgi:nucleotidyltransferase substrate binding protein (TIGR01987 family)